jgi:hypothetical protein
MLNIMMFVFIIVVSMVGLIVVLFLCFGNKKEITTDPADMQARLDVKFKMIKANLDAKKGEV